MLELWCNQHVEYLTKGLDAEYCFSNVKLTRVSSLVIILLDSFHSSRPWLLCYWMVHGLVLLDETLGDDLENDIVDFLSRCQDRFKPSS